MDFLNRLEEWFAFYVVDSIETVSFFDIAFWDPDVTLPLVVLWLIFGATFFTLRFQFVNFRAFRVPNAHTLQQGAFPLPTFVQGGLCLGHMLSLLSRSKRTHHTKEHSHAQPALNHGA